MLTNNLKHAIILSMGENYLSQYFNQTLHLMENILVSAMLTFIAF